MTPDPWRSLVGQRAAIDRLRAAVDNPVHAYLFVGPHGVGKKAAAGVFAGELLAASDPDRAARHRELAARFAHPDVRVVTPTGPQFRVDESKELAAAAVRSPVEGDRKVVVAERFHDANAAAMPPLLKVAEEPPDSTIFVFLADEVRPEHVTVASRCTRIDFAPLSVDDLTSALVADGVAGDVAGRAAKASGGSIERARVLATDNRLMVRHDAWQSIPDRLDGTGAVVAILVEEVRSLIDEAMTPLTRVHEAEMDALGEQEELYGTRGSGRADLEAHHRRMLRRFRTDELRFGLATLAVGYRELIAAGDPRIGLLDAVDRLRGTAEAFERNPNEALLLQALLVDLPDGRDRGTPQTDWYLRPPPPE